MMISKKILLVQKTESGDTPVKPEANCLHVCGSAEARAFTNTSPLFQLANHSKLL